MLKSTELRATVCSAKASFLLSPSFLKRSTSATAPLIVKGNNHGLSLCYSEAQTACFAICIAFLLRQRCTKKASKSYQSPKAETEPVFPRSSALTRSLVKGRNVRSRRTRTARLLLVRQREVSPDTHIGSQLSFLLQRFLLTFGVIQLLCSIPKAFPTDMLLLRKMRDPSTAKYEGHLNKTSCSRWPAEDGLPQKT